MVLFIAHARGMKFAGIRLGQHPLYAKITAVVLLLIAILVASGTIDTWTVVRYFGGRAPAGRGHRLARLGLRPAAGILPVRSALLQHPARLPAGAGCGRRRHLLDHGPRLATARSHRGVPAGRPTRPAHVCACRARSSPGSCAARPWSFCWPWPSASSWAAMRWCGTTTASWWASTTWTRSSRCRCNGW